MEEKQIKTKKLFDGRTVQDLPYYCPLHPTYGRYYCDSDNSEYISGVHRPQIIKFNDVVCNYSYCSQPLAKFNPRLENSSLSRGQTRPRA